MNAKYYDLSNFNAYQCYASCDGIADQCCNGSVFVGGEGCPASEPSGGCLCRNKPHSYAIDPMYSGSVWQLEEEYITNMMNLVNPTSTDVVYMDMETWGDRPTHLYTCYYVNLMNSTGRYTGATDTERKQQNFNARRDRAQSLTSRVKQKNPGTKVLFYNENIASESLFENWITGKSTAVPFGSGDSQSPSFYYAPDVAWVQNKLNASDYSGAYLWISFNCTYAAGLKCPAGIFWDPLISQKIGYLLRQENIKGIFVYPGIYGWTSYGVTLEYYLAHARAFTNGFLKGIDPGPLVESQAAGNCNDGWDNDGDALWDSQDPSCQ
jgi:hypothetical protein